MVKYTCIYCKKETTQKTHFNGHVKCCEKKFNAIISKYKEYNVQNMLAEYTDIVARKTSKYKCKICARPYTSYNGLKNHIYKNNCRDAPRDPYDKIMKNIVINNVPKEKVKYKKIPIPLSLKKIVWDKWIGREIGLSDCLCCRVTEISQMSFHCGHIISEVNGGELKPSNLKPICQACNSSMGTMNMDIYIKKYNLWEDFQVNKKQV